MLFWNGNIRSNKGCNSCLHQHPGWIIPDCFSKPFLSFPSGNFGNCFIRGVSALCDWSGLWCYGKLDIVWIGMLSPKFETLVAKNFEITFINPPNSLGSWIAAWVFLGMSFIASIFLTFVKPGPDIGVPLFFLRRSWGVSWEQSISLSFKTHQALK